MIRKILRAGRKSWKTTVLGLIGGLLVILSAIQALLDSDPGTVFDMNAFTEAVIGVVMIFIGLFTRDADKTSKDSGVED